MDYEHTPFQDLENLFGMLGVFPSKLASSNQPA